MEQYNVKQDQPDQDHIPDQDHLQDPDQDIDPDRDRPEEQKIPAGTDLLRGNADVICLHYRDGGIIPLRFRITDEDGEQHTYTIKDYRDVSGRGAYVTRDGIYVTDRMLVYECRIVVLGQLRRVRLYYHRGKDVWLVRT